MNILFFDTETSGFIKKDIPSDHPEQAWIIQIGAMLVNDINEDLDLMNIMIKPEGRDMHPAALETHGIELDYAQEHGLYEKDAADQFGKLLRKADLVVCHNHDFDWKHAIALLERNMELLSDEARSAFYLDIPFICTMKDKNIKKFVGAKNVKGSLKFPKLTELYEKLFDETFENQHDALADVNATRICFFELLEREVITLDLG